MFNVNDVGILNIVSVIAQKQYENKAVQTKIRWYHTDAIYVQVKMDHWKRCHNRVTEQQQHQQSLVIISTPLSRGSKHVDECLN